MKKSKTSYIIVGILVLALGAGGYAISRQSRSPAAAAEDVAAGVKLQVSRGSIVDQISETGTVEANTTLSIDAQTDGTVAEVYVDDGTFVTAGQSLVRLYNDDLQEEIKQARLSLEAAEDSLADALDTASEVKSAELKLRQAELAAREAQENVDNLTIRATIDGRISAVEIEAGDEINAGNAIATLIDDSPLYLEAYVRESALSKIKVGGKVTVRAGVNQTEYDGTILSISKEGESIDQTDYAYFAVRVEVGAIQAGATPYTLRPGMAAYFTANDFGPGDAVKSTGTRLEAAAVANLTAKVSGDVQSVSAVAGDTVRKGDILAVLENDSLAARLDQAENEIDIARDSLERLRDPDVSDLEIRVDQAESNLENLLQQQANLMITAPMAGTVAGKPVQPGDRINNNGQAVTLLDTANLNVRVSVDELEIRKIALGQEVRVTIDAIPGQNFTGEVVTISSEGTVQSGVTTYDVVVRIREPKEIRPGMTAQVSVVLASKENVLLLPAEALITEGGRSLVRVEGEAGIEFLPVETGLATTEFVEVVSGLAEGDTVLLPASSSTTGGMFGGGGMMGVRPGGGTGGVRVQTGTNRRN